ncbi:MAG: helix-turn-helix transcriptional regulator [Firmicutes bacterium]|nr:helix-turn-helix transcriptional regulator [Bacillota bacterium]
MSIGERIAELRAKQNMSQGQLAQAMGVSRQAVSKWENDQSSPDTLRLIQLADVLDSDVEYLATGRATVFRRPPVVIKTVETKIEEKPVEKVVEKVVERVVKQPPEVQYVEKPVVKKVYRTRYVRNPLEYGIVGIVCLLLGMLIGHFL